MIKKILIALILIYSFNYSFVNAIENKSSVQMWSEYYQTIQQSLKEGYGKDGKVLNGTELSETLWKNDFIKELVWCTWNCTSEEIKSFQEKNWLKVDWTIWAETLTVAQEAIAAKEAKNSNSNNLAQKTPDSKEQIGRWTCSYDWEWSVVGALEGCMSGSKLVKNNWNLKVDDGFKKALIDWTKKIATFLAFWAIFAIAFGSLKMVLSWGEEEKIKKWKDVIKWWIIWFLWVVSAWFLISVVVKVVYTIWW